MLKHLSVPLICLHKAAFGDDGDATVRELAGRPEVNRIRQFRAIFGFVRRFFRTISMACTISAKIVCPHPSRPPA